MKSVHREYQEAVLERRTTTTLSPPAITGNPQADREMWELTLLVREILQRDKAPKRTRGDA